QRRLPSHPACGKGGVSRGDPPCSAARRLVCFLGEQPVEPGDPVRDVALRLRRTCDQNQPTQGAKNSLQRRFQNPAEGFALLLPAPVKLSASSGGVASSVAARRPI